MRTCLALTAVTLITLISCKKDQPEPNSNDTPHTIYAGVYDSTSFFYHEPLIQDLQITWDATGACGSGELLLDLDLDGTDDVQFTTKLLNNDSLPSPCYGNDPYTNLRLFALNEVEVIGKTESVYVGLGTTTTINWIDTMSYQKPIVVNGEWQTIPAGNFLPLWMTHPMTLGSFGPWYTANPIIRYVGIRKGTQMGWIKLDTTDPNNPLILAYTLEKP